MTIPNGGCGSIKSPKKHRRDHLLVQPRRKTQKVNPMPDEIGGLK